MYDIWAFLLQTLTASGVAVLLLVIKAMFRDKLPPKWHFAAWGVLGLVMLIPAGLNGRHALFNWQLPVELIKALCGDYSFSRVLFPFPAFRLAVPKTVGEWIFAGYLLGVIVHLVKYLVSYVRLRQVLRQGEEVNPETVERIRQIALAHKIKLCKTVAVPGLPSAFVCGVLRPVLVLPADEEVDDKVLLHELLHLKSGDTVWSFVICLLRSIHWCNPLLVYCADQAGNDLEARCDQRVLELLEGEERRDYGRILLSMSNDRYARTPGSTCVNNGGKNIRRRIEAIARFKRYPGGMELVSGCAILILALSLAVGVQAAEVYDESSDLRLSLASARSTPCTTPAGAFDTYGKAILEQNGVYRAMCAPEEMQAALAEEMTRNQDELGIFPLWDAGLPAWPDAQGGYYIYNLVQTSKTAYEGLLVVKLNYPPDGQPEEAGVTYLAAQELRVEKEQGRWVTIPKEDFRAVETLDKSVNWGCIDLPGTVYSGTADHIRVDVKVQTVHAVDNTVQQEDVLFGSSSYFDTVPKPNAKFSWESWWQTASCTHLGTETEQDAITRLGLSIAAVYEGEERPALEFDAYADFSATSNLGEIRGSRKLEPGWGPTVCVCDGGSWGSGNVSLSDTEQPVYYAADLYVNGSKVAEMELYLQEGEGT